MSYDCIGVGTGPAGGSAAFHLARRGHSVVLLEQGTLPRYKPCGGLVGDRVAAWFDFHFGPAISMVVRRGRPVQVGDGDIVYEVDYPRPVWMDHRAVFDDLIVQHARQCGAEVIDGALADYTAAIQRELGRKMALARARSRQVDGGPAETRADPPARPALQASLDQLASGEISHQQYRFADLFVSATAGR